MAVDTQQIMDEATKLGELVMQHPAVARYKDARRAVEQDADATQLMGEFDRQIENLQRQQAAGMPVTDAAATVTGSPSEQDRFTPKN